jgi:hypothetical protein
MDLSEYEGEPVEVWDVYTRFWRGVVINGAVRALDNRFIKMERDHQYKYLSKKLEADKVHKINRIDKPNKNLQSFVDAIKSNSPKFTIEIEIDRLQ